MTLATPNATLTIPDKFDLLEASLNTTVYERPQVIRTAVVALIARKHHLQVGIPGIGKTFLVDEMVKRIAGLNGFYYRTLIMKTTTPSEVFGAPSLKALQDDDVYRYNTKFKLPEAYIAFPDELFKGNAAFLNTLLTILNEGLFFNDGMPTKVPLASLFTGCNELPTEPELAAIWDRITFRHEVHALREPANRRKMLNDNVARRRGHMPAIDSLIDWDEILTAQNEAMDVDVPSDVVDALTELIGKLHREGIEPSERRQNDCIPILQANAYRDGRMIADVDDIRILQHVLWIRLEQQATVTKLVMEMANPLDKEAMVLIADLDALVAEIDEIVAENDDMAARRRQGTKISSKLTRIEEKLAELETEAAKSPRRCEMIGEARVRATQMVDRLLHDLWGREKSA